MGTTRTPTPAVRRHQPPGAHYLGRHAPDASLDVTLVLRRRSPLDMVAPPSSQAIRHADFEARYGVDPDDLDRLRSFGRQHGLQELACEPARRTLHLRGTVQALQRAFGVQLGRYELTSGGVVYVGSAQAPTLPDPAVIAVLGLDRRPVARPHFRVAQAQPVNTYTPLQVGQLYDFPAGADGSGQVIAIIELGGGYRQADLDTYFSSLGLATPAITAVSIASGSNQPGGAADAEVMLDIEIAGALAPAAKLAVYFAPNTDQGFYNAISQAAHDSSLPATAMSISWGAPEDSWVTASRDAMETALEDAAALGVTVTAAAGDSGSSDGASDGQPHVDFPAASPSVLACGGTKLLASGGAISSEVTWNETAANEGATGGGVSAVFALPAWQAGAAVPATAGGFAGRGVPDVAGNADPLTGYAVRVDSQDEVVGGTSAVAPLWAALVARLGQQLGHPLGAVQAALYDLGGAAFHDITQGDNGSYAAGAGWDACTGLGSPDGQALLGALQAGAANPAPAPPGHPPKHGGHKPKHGGHKPPGRGGKRKEKP
ncbi:S53 family peptidase [Rhodanobacter thiooxydans]|uniref:S53 family peptidase n=1 Tax=Rhodanobacter thiooxydans TaxID=416169 RepID=UPI000260EFCE|nr:S53 family peptidase [Rhodanobacter thiooxydans]EIL97235.1 peptidase S53 propeptide [Rhodanobacter thiooxydans LCS2]